MAWGFEQYWFWDVFSTSMVSYLLYAAASGFPDLHASLRLFYRDAFYVASPAPRSLGQQFVLEVFGEPRAPSWMRYSYAASVP